MSEKPLYVYHVALHDIQAESDLKFDNVDAARIYCASNAVDAGTLVLIGTKTYRVMVEITELWRIRKNRAFIPREYISYA